MSNNTDDQKGKPVGKLLIFLLVPSLILGAISVFSLIFFGITLLAPDDFTYSSVRFQTSLNQEPLKLFGKRGESITFYIEDHSIAGNWATPTGIALEFERKDPQPSTIQLCNSKEVSWGGVISYSQRSDHKIEIECSFAVPTLIGPENQIVNGRVKGTIIVPKGSDSGRGFTDRTINLNVPVLLEITSTERYKELQHNRLAHVREQFFSCLSLSVLAVLGSVWMIKREKWGHYNLQKNLLILFWILYLILFLILRLTGFIGDE